MKNDLGKILITGAGGMLAYDLEQAFSKAYPGKVVALGVGDLDITSPVSIEKAFALHQPQVVINAAAYTNVDGAETERHVAYGINATGTQYLVDACRTSGRAFVHFSTDHVFDGEVDHARTEEETPNPVNYYATSKLEGERFALAYDRALVLRVQWLYGVKKDRFTTLRGKEVFTPFADQFGAPTWTQTVTQTVRELLRRDTYGLFHFAYEDYASWAQVFEFVKEKLNLTVRLVPKMSSEVSLPAKRPRFSVLSNAKLKRALGVDSMGSWKTDLAAFLDQR
jgi:dTDP-4-dehydrorhamnose reductase